jgi:hypothetical protein
MTDPWDRDPFYDPQHNHRQAHNEGAEAVVDMLAGDVAPSGCASQILRISDSGLADAAFADEAGKELPAERDAEQPSARRDLGDFGT